MSMCHFFYFLYFLFTQMELYRHSESKHLIHFILYSFLFNLPSPQMRHSAVVCCRPGRSKSSCVSASSPSPCTASISTTMPPCISSCRRHPRLGQLLSEPPRQSDLPSLIAHARNCGCRSENPCVFTLKFNLYSRLSFSVRHVLFFALSVISCIIHNLLCVWARLTAIGSSLGCSRTNASNPSSIKYETDTQFCHFNTVKHHDNICPLLFLSH